jgi:TPR repeat protein
MKKILLSLTIFCTVASASIFSDAIAAFQKKEYVQAYALFERSLNNQSSVQANYFIGLMQLRGLGTAQNVLSAKQHLTVASSIGNARAKCLLAEVHLHENAVSKANEILNDASLANVIECQQIKEQFKQQLKGQR